MLKKIKIIKTNNKNFSESCNIGLKSTTTKNIGILNDDTVVTHHSIENLIQNLNDHEILSCVSNCNVGWLDDPVITIDDMPLIPAMKIRQIKDFIKIYNIGNMTTQSGIIQRPWIAFFCAFFTRKTFELIGLMDESFIFDKEDLDYCVRGERLGVHCIQVKNSYIFHFGGISRKNSEDEDYNKHHQNALISSKYYQEKYGRQTFVIWNGPSWVKWDDRNLEIGGVGGSEIWCIHLAREMNTLGYRVIVFNDCPNRTMRFGEIEYKHWTEFGNWNEMNFCDYFISSRSLEPFKLNLKTRFKGVLIHDIWLMLNASEDIQYHNKVDKFFCLSTKHKEFVSNHHNIAKDRILISSNGIDNRRFKIDERRRYRYKAIYTSSPDRGLEHLLDMYPQIKQKIPEFELHVYYGFDFFLPNKKDWVQYMLGKMKSLEIIYHGKVNQTELAEAFVTSRICTYPSHFEETFCISALEAMSAGCIFLSSAYWGIVDTVGDGGILIPIQSVKDCVASEYRERFIGEIVKVMEDDKYFEYWQLKGFDRVERFGWNKIAAKFNNYFKNNIWEKIQ